MDANVAVIWKVRPTPSAQTVRGASPVMSRPPSTTRPASGWSWPLSMLKQVVLPAPFGPISASSRPASTAKLTPSTAFTPPNAFSSPSRLAGHRLAHRAASASCASPSPRALAPVQRAADEALRERQHEHDDRAAQHQPPVFGDGAHQPVLQPRKRERADDRPGHGLHAAEQHHQQRIDRLGDRHVGREHAALEVGVEPAGDARRNRRDDERQPVDARHVEADGLRPHRAVAARAQRVAERREDDRAQREHGRRAQDQREIVVDDLARRPLRRPHAQDAVVAAGQLHPLERHRPGDLREGQRQHRQIDARQPHAEPAEHDARQPGQKRRRPAAPPPSAPPSHLAASAAP